MIFFFFGHQKISASMEEDRLSVVSSEVGYLWQNIQLENSLQSAVCDFFAL